MNSKAYLKEEKKLYKVHQSKRWRRLEKIQAEEKTQNCPVMMIWSFTLSLAAIYKQHKRFWQIVGWGYNCKAHSWEAWNLEKQYGNWEIVSCHRSCVQQQQQQSGVMSVSEGLCTWVQLQLNHHFRLKVCNKILLYCGMCQVQAILPMDKPGRVSETGRMTCTRHVP